MYLRNGHSGKHLKSSFRKLEQHHLKKLVQKIGEELIETLIELPSLRKIYSLKLRFEVRD